MKSYFSSNFFTQNRRTLQESLEPDQLIVITANGIMQKNGDEPFSFFQDSSFWYLTGLNGPGLILVMQGKRTYLIVPGLSAVREAFDGAHDLEAYERRSGIDVFLPEHEGWRLLREELKSKKAVATLGSPPEYLESHGLHMLPYRRRLLSRLKRTVPGIAIRDIRTELLVARCIKQPEELQALRRAIEITGEALLEVSVNTLPTAHYEYELEAALTFGFRNRGADGHAFEPVIGAGAHTTTLHYFENNAAITQTDLIVIDVGASVEHYAADIARTISKQPITGRKADVFHAVAEAQTYAISLIKPGVNPLEYEKAVEEFIGTKLKALGVITEATRENIRRHFPHATSHFLGLDTHDAGDYRAPWKAGMVITCEPGIYIPDEKIGVRIEDDILITEDGHEILSNACSQALTNVQ